MTIATAEPSALSMLNDGELLKRFLTTRDEIAFQELTTRHSGMVYSVAGRMLCGVSAADDIVQAAFLLLIDKAPSLTNRVSVAGWLHQATQFIVNNHRRAEKRRTTAQTASASGRRTMKTATETDPLDQAQTQEALSKLDDALGELREPFRLALVLHYFEGLSVTQIAQRLNIEAGTVKSRLGRGLEKLRSALSRRKSVVGAAALAFLLSSQQAHAAPPLALASLTAAVSGGAAPLSNIIALAQGGKSMFFIAKMKMIAAVAASVLVVSGAAVSGAVLTSQTDRHQPKQTPISVQQETPSQPVSGPVLSATAVTISTTTPKDSVDPSSASNDLSGASDATKALLEKKITHDFVNQNLDETFNSIEKMLADNSGSIKFAFDPAVIEKGLDKQIVNFHINEWPARLAIEWLLRMSGLSMTIDGNVIWLHIDSNSMVQTITRSLAGSSDMSGASDATKALFEKKITHDFVNQNLGEAFNSIEKMLADNSGSIKFTFDQNIIENNLDKAPVSLIVKDMTAQQTIECLLGLNQMSMTVKGNVIQIHVHLILKITHTNDNPAAPQPSPTEDSDF